MVTAPPKKKRRTILTGRDDAAAEGFDRLAKERRRIDVELAELSVRLVDSHHVEDEGFSSLAAFAEAGMHLAGPTARMLHRVGKAMKLCPELKEFLLHGSTMFEHVSAYLDVLTTDGAIVEGDRWLFWMTAETCEAFRERVRERIADVRGRQVRRTLYMTPEGSNEFDKTIREVSHRLGVEATPGEAAEVAFRFYNSKHVLADQAEGTRRKGDTTGDPSRYIPVQARRQVLEEHGDRCLLRWCSNRFWLQFMHLEAHAEGGSREPENLRRGCPKDHAMVDQGLIRLIFKKGRIVAALNKYGRDVSGPRDPPPGLEHLVR